MDQRRRLTFEARCGPLCFRDEKVPPISRIGQPHKFGISALGIVGRNFSAKRANRFLPPSCPWLHWVKFPPH